MTKAIFYKEWIKTRWYFLLLLAVSLCVTAYELLRIQRIVTFNGAGHLWTLLLTRDNVFIERLTYLPLLCGIALAVAQYVPEMIHKRLKLTLHLPYPQYRMILYMLSAGIAELMVVFLLQNLAVYLYLQVILPGELISRILLTALPWFVCGFNAYLFVAAVCTEPSWRMRIIDLLVLAGTTRLYFMKDVPESYNSFLFWLVIAVLPVAIIVLRSVIRFKEGYQD